MKKIIFAYPGGEITLKEYKAKMPVHRILAAVEEQANLFFGPNVWSWELDPHVPAVQCPGGGLIMAVYPAPKEPCL